MTTTLTCGADGRYNVRTDGVHIGWVIRHRDHWRAFVCRKDGLTGKPVGWDFFTLRRDAVAEVEIQREI
jgi:hypothetical protein